jgi:hypothetical protein
MKKHHMKDSMPMEHMGHKGKKSSHALYEHEVEKPHVPSVRKNEPMEPVDDFKGDAMDTAYGQAGEAGCRADQKKIHGQFKNYGWDANTGY